MAHCESLSQTDSQAMKRAEIQGSVKKWTHASYPVYMSVYLDVLAPIRRISLAMQQEIHDPVKVIRRIKEFTWTMAKLILIFEEAIGDDNILTNYTKFLGDVEVDQDGKHLYQNVKLKKYNRTKNGVKQHYKETVANICTSVEERFQGILHSPIFKNIETILDTSSWPMNEDSGSFGTKAINDVQEHFKNLLIKNGCDVEKIQTEWLILKTYAIPMITNDKKCKYLDIWARLFQNEDVKKECENILHIIEIMLIVPFTNAKVIIEFERILRYFVLTK